MEYLGHGDHSQAECSIHDSDIENRSAEEVVQQCNDISISFYEEKEGVLSKD